VLRICGSGQRGSRVALRAASEQTVSSGADCRRHYDLRAGPNSPACRRGSLESAPGSKREVVSSSIVRSGTRLSAGTTRVDPPTRQRGCRHPADAIGTGRMSVTSAISAQANSQPRPSQARRAADRAACLPGDAKGNPLDGGACGRWRVEPGRVEIRLTRLTDLLGSDRHILEQATNAVKTRRRARVFRLAWILGTGRINRMRRLAARRCRLQMKSGQFAESRRAPLMGYRNVRGTLGRSTRRSALKPPRAAQGHVSSE